MAWWLCPAAPQGSQLQGTGLQQACSPGSGLQRTVGQDTCHAQQLAVQGPAAKVATVPHLKLCFSQREDLQCLLCCPAAELHHEVRPLLYLATWQAIQCLTQLLLRPACLFADSRLRPRYPKYLHRLACRQGLSTKWWPFPVSGSNVRPAGPERTAFIPLPAS